MAETLSDSVGKDPLQDIFIAKTKTPQKLSAENCVVNNEDFAIVNTVDNKQFQVGKKADNHNFDNGVVKQTNIDCEMTDQQILILNQDCVKWNNCENTGLTLHHFSDSRIISEQSTNVVENADPEESGSEKKIQPVIQETSNNSENQNLRKGKKGISFPKDNFISGYFDPPDPWKNASPWTTEELINAYKKSCELHGTKPIGKILQQLQQISSSEKRVELFSLKGEKLDQKQCECIEEIFRRVQFKSLDLEASHLDDECATALFDMIEYYETTCQLNISFNKNIQARGWQACSRLVRRTPNLTYLDIRNCDLNERFIPILGRALKLGCHLTIIHMENLALSGRPLIILVAALKMNETLQELFLADNKLMPSDGVQLGNLLRNNHKLNLLDLRNNHLQDVGTSHLCDGLLEQNLGRGLRTLVLWNNQINYQSMTVLGRALAISECLETLNIGHNTITNEGVHLLKDGLLKTNSLLRLGLQGTKISDEGAVALAEYIADSNILLRIDLRENDIKTGGLMALSHAMRVNTSVIRIDLDKDPKKESGIKDYADQQSRLLRDILTFQQRNVQTALEREEQERKQLEEKAASEEAAEKPVALCNAEEVVVNNINETFDLIEENEALELATCEEKYKKDVENRKLKDEASQPTESVVEKIEEMSSKNVSYEKAHHRPNQLFPYKHLHPQETLDSPVPTANENPLIAVFTTSPVVSETSKLYTAEKKLLSSIVTTPPEMILSPQYFPKQIARKIFSVSRVDEDPSWQKMSSSPTPSPIPGFDPLNISPVPLISSQFAPGCQLIPAPVIAPHLTLGVAQHSTNTDQPSPCSSLFHSLSEQSEHLLAASPLSSDASFQARDTDEVRNKTDFSTTNCDKHELSVSDAQCHSVMDSKKENFTEDKAAEFAEWINELKEGCSTIHELESVKHQNDCSSHASDLQQVDNNDFLSDNVFEDILERGDTVVKTDIIGQEMPHTLSETSMKSLGTISDLNIIPSSSKWQAAYHYMGTGDVIHLKEGQTELVYDSDQHQAADTLLASSDLNSSNSNKSLQQAMCTGNTHLGKLEPTNLFTSSSFIGEQEISLQETLSSQSAMSNADDICGSLDNDIVTLELNSFDEEPWLAVGVENDSDLDKSDSCAKQPDFFTTLSSNGFTQELASALTNLDGSNGYYEEDNNFEFQNPDEYEKELDSMLAVVHGDLPWPLKDS